MQHIKSKVESTGKTERVVFSAASGEQQKKKNKTILYVIGGVLLLTAIGVGIYLYKKHKNKLSLESGGNLPATDIKPVVTTPVATVNTAATAATTATTTNATVIPSPTAATVAPNTTVATSTLTNTPVH